LLYEILLYYIRTPLYPQGTPLVPCEPPAFLIINFFNKLFILLKNIFILLINWFSVQCYNLFYSNKMYNTLLHIFELFFYNIVRKTILYIKLKNKLFC
jgi:hypothetical protein